MTTARTVTSYRELPTDAAKEVRLGRESVRFIPMPESTPQSWRIEWRQGYRAVLVLAGYSGTAEVADIAFDSREGMTAHATMMEFDELVYAYFGGPVPE